MNTEFANLVSKVESEFVELLVKNNVPGLTYRIESEDAHTIKTRDYFDGEEYEQEVDASITFFFNPNEMEVPEQLFFDYDNWAEKYYEDQNLLVYLVDEVDNEDIADFID